ncbi:hypothetical protein NKR23_g10665 [Pleurostoma richardsiae]|uniref:INO80 complex subunit B-like conserved region domain-containing protein n=1 Tax=Pleurostoma richardsiae TaxID=41990 RepID=A0AA38R4S4_9PEZI|nr:hypothetical protein NKR23_g10665 [Pleurostoma richardsiae]
MSSRPRRSAAQRASVAITDMADRDNMTSRSRRSGDSKSMASLSQRPPSSSPSSTREDSKDHTYLTVKLPASKLRQATATRRGNQISVGQRDRSESSEIVTTRRPTRGGKKSYVVESESEEEEDEIEVGGEEPDDDEEDEDDDDDAMDDDLGDDDAEGEEVEDEMDIDAEGEDEDLGDEDADGDVDMDAAPPAPPPTIKISKPVKGALAPTKVKSTPTSKRSVTVQAPKVVDDDDDELSELESDADEEINDTVEAGGDEDAEGDEEDVDAEGEEIEVADEEDEEVESGTETPAGGSRAETPDLSRMTVRQRARFGGVDPGEYQALSNDIQAKKHFTAEEISMRRAEMARRRRNLSEKRNEEVKMETINKLLKKQAPKTNRRNLQAGDETPSSEPPKANPVFIRWISNKAGSRVAVPEEIIDGPAGRVFVNGLGPRKFVEEVS